MTRGAKKGENRFKDAQTRLVEERLHRIKNIVEPKIKAMCNITYFPNKTKFQKMCAQIFNEDIPKGMKKITQRTIATNQRYWLILGSIYHRYYNEEDSKSLKDMKRNALSKLTANEEIEDLRKTVVNLKIENQALKDCISKLKLNQKSVSCKKHIGHSEDITNLVVIIDYLIKSTADIVVVNRNARTITNMANDINGLIPKKFTNTYFNIIEGK